MGASQQTLHKHYKKKTEDAERLKRDLKQLKRKGDDLITRIRRILKREFPDDTVDVTLSGIRDNIHVVVMSRKLDKIRSHKRDEYVWSLLDKSDLTDVEKSRISLILALSPGDVR